MVKKKENPFVVGKQCLLNVEIMGVVPGAEMEDYINIRKIS